MRVLLINVVCGIRSTGRICTDLAEKLTAEGHEVKIAYGREEVPEQYKKYAVKIGNKWDQSLHGLRTRILDEHGFGSKKVTKDFLKWADKYNPDMLWLHNIHGYYINVELLFAWIKKRPDMQVKWTLHDCWAFTGHCSHFMVAQCDQWQEHCMQCVEKRRYPASVMRDNCKNNYARKKSAFTGVNDMTIITPSQWLANLVKRSFLARYPVEVCYNTIDTNVFKPTPSDFRTKYGLQDKKVILGVASVWNERKGFKDYIQLANMLNDNYRIVLIGLNNKQLNDLPANVIGLTRTNNTLELAQIYSEAFVFLNLTYEDNFPTVNIEALSCGTPVITYKTGGSSEAIDENTGVCVNPGNLKDVLNALNLVHEISRDLCRKRGECFSKNRSVSN